MWVSNASNRLMSPGESRTKPFGVANTRNNHHNPNRKQTTMAKPKKSEVVTTAPVLAALVAAGTLVTFKGYEPGAEAGGLKAGEKYTVGEYNAEDRSYTLLAAKGKNKGKEVDVALRSEFAVDGEPVGVETDFAEGDQLTINLEDSGTEEAAAQAETETVAPVTPPAPAAKVKVLASVKDAIKANDGSEVAAALALHAQVEQSYFVLGGVLAVVQENDSHHELLDGEGHPLFQSGQKGFAKWVESAVGIKYRKAQYLVQVYTVLSGLGVAESKLAGIGWSKLKEIIPFLVAGGDSDFALKECRNKSITELKASIRKKMLEEGMELHGNAGGTTSEQTAYNVVVHNDQATVINAALALAAQQLEVANPAEDPTTLGQCMNHIISAWYQAESANV